MWFPYSLPTSWKSEGNREHAHDSLADDQQRAFLIGLQLRNPVTREWSVELQLAEPKWMAQRDPTGEIVQVGYLPDENERLAEITCKLEDTNTHNAVRRCYALVSSILDYWSADYGRGFSIGGLRIADLKHDARWRVVPHWPSAQAFHPAMLEGLPARFWPMASLYREGRTSTSDRYRFLCSFTILETWKRHAPPFDSPEEVMDGLSSPEPDLRVTQELMVLSGMLRFAPELEGVLFAELPDRLMPWRRAAQRFMLEGHEDAMSDDLNRVFEWTALANLVDLAAQRILSRFMQRTQYQSVDTAPEFKVASTPSAT